MLILLKDWINYINKLSAIDKKAAELVLEWIEQNGINDRDSLIKYANSVVMRYAEASGALTATMYDEICRSEGFLCEAAEVAPIPEYREVAKTINGILKKSQKPSSIANGIGRLVKRTGADTMLKNAERDKAEAAWVPNGDSCAMCIILAGRGWQRITSKSFKDGHAEHIHSNCDCTYAIRHSTDTNVEGYDYEKYKKMYDEAEGDTPEEKTNSLRRMLLAEKAKEANTSESEAIYKDRTEEWIENFKRNKPVVIDAKNYQAKDGTIYTIDGKNVFFEYDTEEYETAQLLSKATGKEVHMCPVVKGQYRKITTPDYLLGDENEHWDRKGLSGTGKDAIRDNIKRKKEQASRFVIDITNWKGEIEDIMRQVDIIFKARNTSFVKTLVVISHGKIIKVVDR